MINSDNYKGIFYNEEKVTKFYEGGAHFKYSDLVYALNCLLKKNIVLHRQESTTSLNIDNVTLDTNTNINNQHRNPENARFNTLERETNSKSKVSNLIKINLNNNFLNNKIVLNTEKNKSKQKPKKNLIISLLNDAEKYKNETIRRNQSQFHKKNLKIANRIINNNKITILLNNNYNNNKIANEKKNFQTIIPESDDNSQRSHSKFSGQIKKNNLPLIQSSYFNKITKKISLNHKYNKKSGDLKKYKYNLYSPTRNYLAPGYYKDSDVFTNVKNEGFNENDANIKYDEIMNKIMKNNHFASIEIIKNIEKNNDSRVKKFFKNMKKKEENLKGYKNIFDMQQNSSRDRKVKLTEINI